MTDSNVNATKLDRELKAAGLPILGVSSDGRIDWPAGRPTATERARADTILAAHDPTTPTVTDQQLINLAQSAVGVKVDELTAAQVRALLAIVLRKVGAVGPDLTVQPLPSWFIRNDSA